MREMQGFGTRQRDILLVLVKFRLKLAWETLCFLGLPSIQPSRVQLYPYLSVQGKPRKFYFLHELLAGTEHPAQILTLLSLAASPPSEQPQAQSSISPSSESKSALLVTLCTRLFLSCSSSLQFLWSVISLAENNAICNLLLQDLPVPSSLPQPCFPPLWESLKSLQAAAPKHGDMHHLNTLSTNCLCPQGQ